jgi:hypothetical protein
LLQIFFARAVVAPDVGTKKAPTVSSRSGLNANRSMIYQLEGDANSLCARIVVCSDGFVAGGHFLR